MPKIVVLLLSALLIAPSALARGLAGDWIGQMKGGFRVRIHFERTGSGFSGKLINPSDNETVLDQVTSDATHLHFAVHKLNLSYDAVWSEREKVWKFIVDCHPFYANYQASTERLIPLVMMKAIEAIPVFRESDATGHRQN